MDKETWNRIQELLPEYLKTPESDRDAFLEQHCEGNEALARQIRKLAITPGSGFLEPVDGLDEPTDAPYPRGTRIGEFEISRRIGSGAMGVVYLARQESVSRDVALKVLPAEWGAHTERLARFKTEAIAAAKLHHPNIVQVHSAGVDAGRYYIAMEFIEGPDLATVIKDLKAGRRAHATIPAFDEKGYARRIAEVIRTMAAALDYAHHREILHRDVKPSNILLDTNGEPYLADFGLARDLGADGISGSHQVLGTPHYMSPEMVRARRVAIDHRTDVFSLGAVLYELLTLRRPFASGETSIPPVLAAITDSDPPGLRRQGVHPDLETICFKALEKSPEKRLPSAGALAEQIDLFLANEPLTIRTRSRTEKTIRWLRRHRVAMGFVVLLVSLASVAASWRFNRWSRVEAVLGDATMALDERPGSAKALQRAQVRLRDASERCLPSQRSRLRQALSDIEAWGLDEWARYEESLARAAACDTPACWADADEALERARYHRFQAELLLPEKAGDAAREFALPTLVIDGDLPGLAVEIRSIDLRTGIPGPPEASGSTPIGELPLPRGHYRVSIENDTATIGEFVRLLDQPARSHAIRLPDRAPDVSGMIRIERANIRLALWDRGVVEVEVEPFHIDTTEVTIGQYRAYLRESGRPLPLAWRADRVRDLADRVLNPDTVLTSTEWDLRPIAGINLGEARAYAEWYGKRLPTVFEFDLAARGPELRRYPWTTRPTLALDEVRRHAVVGDPPADPASVDRGPLAEYLARTRDVTDHAIGKSPFGLHHTYGNVKEWTETLALNPTTKRVLLGTYLIRGKGWDSPIQSDSTVFDMQHFDKISADMAPFSLGFRCVRSAR